VRALDDVVHEADLVRKQIRSGVAQLPLRIAEPKLCGAGLKGTSFRRGPAACFRVRPRIAALDELVMREVAHLR